MADGMELIVTKNSDSRLRYLMPKHYSHPKGFVGRSICYAILYDGFYHGHIVAGSVALFSPGRADYFGDVNLVNLVGNTFYHVFKRGDKYPIRNFTVAVLNNFVELSIRDWFDKYGDYVIGFESLVELPRTGELYKRAGWDECSELTKGWSCRRISAKLHKSTDAYKSSARIWMPGTQKRIFRLRVMKNG